MNNLPRKEQALPNPVPDKIQTIIATITLSFSTDHKPAWVLSMGHPNQQSEPFCISAVSDIEIYTDCHQYQGRPEQLTRDLTEKDEGEQDTDKR